MSAAQAQLVIVDTDAGVDDATAILSLLAASCRHLASVVAITTVRGNVGVDQVCLNVLRTLKVANRLDIPVYKGSDRTLIGTQNVTAAHYHGRDGLGDVPDPEAPDSSLVKSENAVLAMIRLVNQNPGQITLLSIGPLTNVAVALRNDPMFGKKLRQCVIMGGNSTGKGNVTATAEFNFYVDPEAADVALTQLRCPITLVTWELCLKYRMTWEWYDRFIQTPTPQGRFLRTIGAHTHDIRYSSGGSDNPDRQGHLTCDEIAAAIVLDDRVCSKSVDVVCRVDVDGRLTRGQAVVDWNDAYNGRPRRETNVRLVVELDMDRYLERLMAAVL